MIIKSSKGFHETFLLLEEPCNVFIKRVVFPKLFEVFHSPALYYFSLI